MNSVQIVGRLTRDPEVRYANSGTSVASFTVAVDRIIKSENENADFISCTAFGKTAEFLEKYFVKGNKIGLIGRIQTGSYTNKDNIKVYTTTVIAERVEFVEGKGNKDYTAGCASKEEGFMNIPEGFDEELPFN